ncbi:MAG: nickel pincer cofactor biosynthesis protein LarC, partial [Lachnospiraceae bacterium]|nr:nickel pincer cofactor biosynthesis protein LarC [Lachnospiraceae bacterium]
EHGHTHTHHHSSLSHIEAVIDGLFVSDKVKTDAKAIYKLIAEAEAFVHHSTITDIHFHEVGTLDAVADIVGGCMLVEAIHPDRILASPVHVGNGHVHCAHGVLPVPAPATAVLLKNIPFYSGQIEGELCTPTGAALLSYFVQDFGSMPILTCVSTGYGLGSKDFAAANMVRAFLGDAYEEKSIDVSFPDSPSGSVSKGIPEIVELRCNIDDMTPEALGYVQDIILNAGALDVMIIPVYMKKNRPGSLLYVTCKTSEEDAMAALLFKHTTTAGIRRIGYERRTLSYDFITADTPYGKIRIKHYFGYGTEKYKPEFEDVAAASKKYDVSFQTVIEAALKSYEK